MGFGLGLPDTAHGLENENQDRPYRGKAPAGPTPGVHKIANQFIILSVHIYSLQTS